MMGTHWVLIYSKVVVLLFKDIFEKTCVMAKNGKLVHDGDVGDNCSVGSGDSGDGGGVVSV